MACISDITYAAAACVGAGKHALDEGVFLFIKGARRFQIREVYNAKQVPFDQLRNVLL